MPHELKLWDCIPGSDFEIPPAPTNESARGHSRRVWHWLQEAVLQRANKDASRAVTECERPSPDELDSVARQPDWSEAARALAAKQDEWFANQHSADSSVRALVGPPGCDVSGVIHALAHERKLNTLSPPPSHAISDDGESDRINTQLADRSDDEILAIPHLERFYLRHADGLELVRNLTERLMPRRRVLLGCDSWAWAFLQQAIGIEDMLGEPMTLAPFDAQRLDVWFRSHCDPSEREFRQGHDDEPVFPSRPDESAPPETSVLMESLAARARGNLGVALAVWRYGLRTCKPDSGASAAASQTVGSVYWVVSPSELELPRLSTGMLQLHRFILHALLLHGGLPLSTLLTLLPYSRQDVRGRVSELHTAGVLDEQGDTYRVALTAYPEVRQDLVGRGFLADAF